MLRMITHLITVDRRARGVPDSRSVSRKDRLLLPLVESRNETRTLRMALPVLKLRPIAAASANDQWMRLVLLRFLLSGDREKIYKDRVTE